MSGVLLVLTQSGRDGDLATLIALPLLLRGRRAALAPAELAAFRAALTVLLVVLRVSAPCLVKVTHLLAFFGPETAPPRRPSSAKTSGGASYLRWHALHMGT